MELYKKQSFSETFKVYFDRRMTKILLLGAISGFPWVIIGSSLSLWLKEDGLSRSTIGWAGLIFAVYAFNYLWAPIIDRIRIPWLTKKVGHRRGWIITMQSFILICLVSWSFINPTTNLALVITIGLIIAIASATQDITVDALRIEQIGEHEGKSMQAGAAMAVVGWWTGYKLGGVVALNSAEFFQEAGFENYWQTTFLVLGIIIILCNIGLLFVKEPQPTDRAENQKLTDDFFEKITDSGYSRIPVYSGNESNIIGILYVKELLVEDDDISLRQTEDAVDKKFLRVRGNDMLDRVLARMLKNRQHLAIVQNSQKQFIGVVSMEDIIEEIIQQEIEDEDDGDE